MHDLHIAFKMAILTFLLHHLHIILKLTGAGFFDPWLHQLFLMWKVLLLFCFTGRVSAHFHQPYNWQLAGAFQQENHFLCMVVKLRT